MHRPILAASRAVSLALLAVLTLAAPAGAGLGFRVLPVDTLGNTGIMPSLAVGGSGRSHVSYGDATMGALKYAAEGPDLAWAIEVVDATVSVTEGGLISSSLQIDPSGAPSIAYNSAGGDLLYARKEGGSWTIETADEAGTTRGVVSLALDPQGNPAISYQDAAQGVLRVARRADGAWAAETVDPEAGAGGFSSLAFDAAGVPHVAYFFSTGPGDGRLRYAVRRGAAWAIETLADPPGWDAGWAPSIAVDGAGVPHIAYFAAGEGALGYVTKSGSTWVHDVVDGPAFGQDAAIPGRLAVGGAVGAPSISYYVAPGRDIRYAWKSSTGWRRQTFATDGELGLYPSHVPGSAASGPRIALYDAGRGDLLFGSSEIAVTGPRGGEVWLSGTDQVVAWAGRGPVDIDLSVDGGLTFAPLASAASASPTRVTVPKIQTKAAKVRVRAPGSFGAALSDSVFSILEVALQADLLAWLSGKSLGGVNLAWPEPPPGPGPKGFRLERVFPEPASRWTVVASRESAATGDEKPEYFDAQGRLGARYRLVRVDDLGNEFLVGETGVLEKKPAR